ncbi:MAG: response regulator [Leptolyngbyaceae cyanobacterium CRU_2_3]|nr:response regulator [Leptolyngbyaceae cyanobacterium CRU_2_3]
MGKSYSLSLASPTPSWISRNLLTRLIVGGTTLVVGLATYFSYQTVRQATLENLKRDALSRLEHGVDEIDSWLATLKTRVEMLANTEAVRSVDWSIASAYLQAEDKRIDDFAVIALVTREGWRDSTIAKGKRVNVSNQLWFKKTMAGQVYVSDPRLTRTTSLPSVSISAPIVKTANSSHAPIGVLGGAVSIERIQQITNQLRYGDNSYAFSLNSEGRAIVHPNSAFMSTLDQPVPSLIESEDQDLARIAQKMVNRQNGIELVRLDGVEQYVAYLPLQETNWSVSLVIPRENIESQLQLLDGIAFVILALAGMLIGVLVYVQSFEQSQLRRSKLAADAANQAKSEFLSNISHELRTPLNGILGYAQILSRSTTWAEKEQRGIQIIYQCSSHLLTLINDILDLSKIEAHRLELYPTPIHLPTFLQGVVEICRVRAEQKGLEFIYAPDANLPEAICADEKRLRQVLINLLGNGTKFTDQGSVTFKIEVSQLSSFAELSNAPAICVRFTIADTGVGIAPAQIESIFKPFKQVGDRTRQTEGTGLGLSISSQIVDLMGGQIQVKSQPGVGSNFFFEVKLPLAMDWMKKSAAPSGRTIIGYEGDRRTVLIVDDHWENRSVLVTLLEPLGFELVEAQDGQAGLAKAAAQPDLIITDLAMPEMNGFEMLQKLRSDDMLKHLKVIVSSASVSDIDRQQSTEAGGDDFLAKPVQVDELFKMLQHHLDLTWIYQPAKVPCLPSPSSTLSAFLEHTDKVLPDRTQLHNLLELARQGRLKKLIETAKQLEAQNPATQAFVEQVIQLAQTFQAEKLEHLLEHLFQSST